MTIYGILQDCVNSYFIASADANSDGMYANSVRQLVTHEIKRDCCKPEVVWFNVEVAVARCRSKLYVYSFMHKPVLDLERWQYSDK